MREFTVAVEIDLPRARVVELFDNTDNLVKWQTGLQHVELLSGQARQPGAQSRLVFRIGKHTMELMETVTERRLPEETSARCEWSGGANTMRYRFLELGPQRTRVEGVCGYQFRNLPLKLMGFFRPGLFRKQTLSFLENFKAFAEEGRDVRQVQGS